LFAVEIVRRVENLGAEAVFSGAIVAVSITDSQSETGKFRYRILFDKPLEALAYMTRSS